MSTVARRAPRVAVTGMHSGTIKGLRFGGSAASDAILRAVVAAGGEPAVLSLHSSLAAQQRLEGYDALLIPGGADINPARYGAEVEPHTVVADSPHQDQFEADLLMAAAQAQMRVLAICRGMQLVNVEFGGTMQQDVAGDSIHRNSVHDVEIVAGSLLSRVFNGEERVAASSYHHQAVADLGQNLRVTARANDGTVEALEHETAEIIAVQWHPEDDIVTREKHAQLFQWLVWGEDLPQ
ncbi:gamma-glutamyl-gamma-aminobutyrate hydrolase family protein [Leucobacter sp. OH1287]|uniref:gamma-glutamyl-gamma-aminobutyrate hydrolase family protein n=1 Tax=Leucobacter sp. OH1287 TaxID=2491049 RepID=UPI0013152BE4|nr:gamma-glutamyl-gamma-aminobutyrate hydrolase family protein [Leucobacter sp. OH1287]